MNFLKSLSTSDTLLHHAVPPFSCLFMKNQNVEKNNDGQKGLIGYLNEDRGQGHSFKSRRKNIRCGWWSRAEETSQGNCMTLDKRVNSDKIRGRKSTEKCWRVFWHFRALQTGMVSLKGRQGAKKKNTSMTLVGGRQKKIHLGVDSECFQEYNCV